MPEFVMLVGLPGSGKTTYRKTHYPNHAVISGDEVVSEYARVNGISHDEAFGISVYWIVEKALTDALERGLDIVHDHTSVKSKTRSSMVRRVSERGYTAHAVVFSLTDAEHARRLAERVANGGKTVPPEVIANMANAFVPPSKKEGFASIKYIRS